MVSFHVKNVCIVYCLSFHWMGATTIAKFGFCRLEVIDSRTLTIRFMSCGDHCKTDLYERDRFTIISDHNWASQSSGTPPSVYRLRGS